MNAPSAPEKTVYALLSLCTFQYIFIVSTLLIMLFTSSTSISFCPILEWNWCTVDPWTIGGLGVPTLCTVESLCEAYSQPSIPLVPQYLRFLHTYGSSASTDSTKHGLCSTLVFTTEKNLAYKWTHAVRVNCIKIFFYFAVPF